MEERRKLSPQMQRDGTQDIYSDGDSRAEREKDGKWPY